MSNTYRALSKAAEAMYSEGVFDHDFTPTDEQDVLNSGLLELVPRKYRVLSNNYAAGKQGDVVDLGLLKEIEAALIQGGHLERVDAPAKDAPATGGADDKPAAKAADKKEK
jgi:hypothetical protein